MKRMLNTLYVTTQGAYLCQEGDTVLVRVDKETKLRVPVLTLGGIVCFGQVSCSPFLLGLCAENGVSVSFMTEFGRFLAKVQGPVSGNVLLRRTQYRWADDPEQSATISRAVVTGKVANARTVLMRGERDREDAGVVNALGAAADHLGALLKTLKNSMPLDSVRGIEGDAARAYFGAFDGLISAQREDFPFVLRNRRPPLDNTNALLSFVYALLANDVRSALESVGLDPAVGFLHRDRPGRPGLALDLMEEFRPWFADRLVLSLINRQQVKGNGFTEAENGAVTMNDDTRKEVLTAYQKRKQEEVHHPFLDEKVPIGMVPHAQALLLARYIRGDLDGYPPFIWR